MNYEKYKNTLIYPKKPVKVCVCSTPFKETDNFCSKCGKKVKVPYKLKTEKYKKELKEYREHEANLLEHFKSDAFDEVGLTDHPKADKAYSFAWEHGHSAGLQEIYHWLEEVSDLILD